MHLASAEYLALECHHQFERCPSHEQDTDRNG
jgi:hypothetical protein